jgi:RNA polymerase sigma factor for flagellar operon FliA
VHTGASVTPITNAASVRRGIRATGGRIALEHPSVGHEDHDGHDGADDAWVEVGTGSDPAALVNEHLWLVDRLAAQAARRFPSYVERNELWSAGVLGLVEAARRYDPSYNVPFAAYASARVRGEMLENARAADIAPRRLRRSLRDLAEITERLTHTLGRAPSLQELADAADVDVSFVRERLQRAAELATTSLDGHGAHDDRESGEHGAAAIAASMSAAIADRDSDPAEVLGNRELLGTLREAVASLPEPLKSVLVRSHWGNERLADIAADMGVSFQRVAQYRVEAITALTAWFATIYDNVPAPDRNQPGSVRRAAFCAGLARRSSWQARLELGARAAAALDGDDDA